MLKEGIFSYLISRSLCAQVSLLFWWPRFWTIWAEEVGIMKATGLEYPGGVRSDFLFEQLLISLLGATIAILLSILWVKGFNGAFIAQFFIAEITMLPKFTLPARFLPLPWKGK